MKHPQAIGPQPEADQTVRLQIDTAAGCPSIRIGFTDQRLTAHGGMVVCDLDNDGDLDVVINNADGPPEIYRNDCAAPRVAVKLKGRAPNTFGVGAKVKLIGKKTQAQEMIAVLREHRTALVAAAVTGQIDVRGV